MKYLGYRQVRWIHRRVIEETGGSFGIRDEGLLLSALARPQASFSGQDLYPTLFEKAAALFESMVRNHPFLDGNKRAAWECMDLLLEVNSYRLLVSHRQGYEVVSKVVAHELTVQQMADWIQNHSRPLRKGE